MLGTKQPNNDCASLEREVEKRTLDLEQSRLEVIWHLAMAAEFCDDETSHHVVRIGCYCPLPG